MDSTVQTKIIRKKIKIEKGLARIETWSEKAGKLSLIRSKPKFLAYKAINGKQKGKVFSDIEAARAWRKSPFQFEDTKKEEMTFRELTERYFSKPKIKNSTLVSYQSKAKHLEFFNNLLVSQINTPAIDEWLRSIKNPAYLATQHKTRVSYKHEFSLLRVLLVYYSEYFSDSYVLPFKKRHMEDCIVDWQKYQQAKQNKQLKFIPRAQFIDFLSQLLKEAEYNPKKRVYYSLAFFQLHTGCRIGEIAALDFRDIDWDLETVMISKTVDWARIKGAKTEISQITKTGKVRQIKLTGSLVAALKQQMEVNQRKSGLIFSHDGFMPISYRSIQHHFNKAFIALGSHFRSTHILRHSFATDYLGKTSNESSLQGIMGHSSNYQTRQYAKVTFEAIDQGMRAYEAATKNDSNVTEIKKSTSAL